jgi:hypothetical protein
MEWNGLIWGRRNDRIRESYGIVLVMELVLEGSSTVTSSLDA